MTSQSPHPLAPAFAGHDHSAMRAAQRFSRRLFIGGSVGAAAAMATTPFWLSSDTLAADARPRPIRGGLAGPDVVRVELADGVYEQASITDFDGVAGIAHMTGFGTHTINGVAAQVGYDCDMRFMDGLYVALDGTTRRGSFTFL